MSENASSRFRINSTRDTHVIEIHLPANIEALEFDVINEQLNAEVTARGAARWIVDLAHAEYIGSALLGMLINLRTRIRSTRGRLVLCELTPPLERVIQTSSMERLFTIVASRDEACALG